MESNSFPSFQFYFIISPNSGLNSSNNSKKNIDSSNSSSTIFNLFKKSAVDFALQAAL